MPLKTHLDEQPSLNLTPMIDIVFLLIIFFMVGTKFTELERKIALEVPQISESRVSRGVNHLLEEGRVVDFSQWSSGYDFPEVHETFDEAGRCAQEVITRCQLGD